MLPILPMAMDTHMPMLVSPLDPALVLTQSPRELFPMLDMLDTMVTTLARGLLMPMPTMVPILMLPLLPMLPVSPSAPAPVLTPSPRVWMLQPRDTLPTLDMLDTISARGLLMLMPTMVPILMLPL